MPASLKGASVCCARKSGDTHILSTSPLLKMLDEKTAVDCLFQLNQGRGYIHHFLATLVGRVV